MDPLAFRATAQDGTRVYYFNKGMHEHSKLFSIVTVCLNPGTDLDPTVASVLDQDFEDYELIIKDGGSTDGTQNRTWTDPRVRFHSFPDKGIFDAMNQALKLATGKFVCFLNAGDHFLDQNVLGDMARFVKANEDAEFFYGDVFKATGRAGINIYPECLSRFYLFTRMICHQCWFVSRKTYLSYGGFETQFPGGGECRLLLKMLMRDRLKYQHVPRVVVWYKGGGHSATHSVVQQNRIWIKELKREIFSPAEIYIYDLIWRTWTIVKPIIYDHILRGLWSRVQRYRSRRNLTRIKRDAVRICC